MERKKITETEQVALIASRSVILLAIFFVVVAGSIALVMLSSHFTVGLDGSTQKLNSVASSKKPFDTGSLSSSNSSKIPENKYWKAPDESDIPPGKEGAVIFYGKELIVHTAKYLGPKGTVMHIANMMNCQNCHNEAGTKSFALNFSAVKSTYPQYKARSNSFISIEQRINGCIQRSLNGSNLPSTSKEMVAIVAYIKWLGKDVVKGEKPKNAGIMKLAFLNRAANPLKGKLVYANVCSSCHAENGEGKEAPSVAEFIYPPLWGKNSYNDGAGLFRISNFAGFVKNNMPFGTNYEHPMLNDEQAWDVAAFVNSKARPHKDQTADWKKLKEKPIDFPFGPYADKFSELQHKYGPFTEIANAQKK